MDGRIPDELVCCCLPPNLRKRPIRPEKNFWEKKEGKNETMYKLEMVKGIVCCGLPADCIVNVPYISYNSSRYILKHDIGAVHRVSF